MYLLFNGGRIHYNDFGKGETLILLHGYLETSEIWQSFAEKLAASFRVITVDLPGHGSSDSYGATHTMDFMAEAVRELIDTAGLTKVFLTGHSLGGYVTLAFADLYPELLRGYCLFHSQPFPDTPETIEKRLREIALVEQGKKEMFYPENIARMFAAQNLENFPEAVHYSTDLASRLSDTGIIAALNGMMVRPSRLSVMENGKVPLLWILGALDNYIPCIAMQKRVKLPANARLIVLSSSGHMGFIEEEEESVKSLSNFIRSLS
jgi:pimeloyl-ACP methyl ester carboxylesterase